MSKEGFFLFNFKIGDIRYHVPYVNNWSNILCKNIFKRVKMIKQSRKRVVENLRHIENIHTKINKMIKVLEEIEVNTKTNKQIKHYVKYCSLKKLCNITTEDNVLIATTKNSNKNSNRTKRDRTYFYDKYPISNCSHSFSMSSKSPKEHQIYIHNELKKYKENLEHKIIQLLKTIFNTVLKSITLRKLVLNIYNFSKNIINNKLDEYENTNFIEVFEINCLPQFGFNDTNNGCKIATSYIIAFTNKPKLNIFFDISKFEKIPQRPENIVNAIKNFNKTKNVTVDNYLQIMDNLKNISNNEIYYRHLNNCCIQYTQTIINIDKPLKLTTKIMKKCRHSNKNPSIIHIILPLEGVMDETLYHSSMHKFE